MAYYPDGRQEQLLKQHRAPECRRGQSTPSTEPKAAAIVVLCAGIPESRAQTLPFRNFERASCLVWQ